MRKEREARAVADPLEREFGVSVRWVEDRSRNTHENAVYSAEMLRRAGIDTVVLVVHSFDVLRGRTEFAAAGIKTLAAPTGIPSNESDTALAFVPSMAGLRTSYYAIYDEITANLVHWTTRALGQ